MRFLLVTVTGALWLEPTSPLKVMGHFGGGEVLVKIRMFVLNRLWTPRLGTSTQRREGQQGVGVGPILQDWAPLTGQEGCGPAEQVHGRKWL